LIGHIDSPSFAKNKQRELLKARAFMMINIYRDCEMESDINFELRYGNNFCELFKALIEYLAVNATAIYSYKKLLGLVE
jgi:hypothetical protein